MLAEASTMPVGAGIRDSTGSPATTGKACQQLLGSSILTTESTASPSSIGTPTPGV